MFKHFYHERVRKSVAIFGAMFNNIYVVRTTKAKSKERETLSQMKVPLAYGPQRKFLERISEMFDGEDEERQLAKLYTGDEEVTGEIKFDEATLSETKRKHFVEEVNDDVRPFRVQKLRNLLNPNLVFLKVDTLWNHLQIL